MFQAGKTYKVKVELTSGEVGFGRATIVSKEGSKLLVQLSTSKKTNQVLPKGSRLCFVTDSVNNPFQGLWMTTVGGSRIHGGKTIMECGNPKFEAVGQRRKSQRLPLNCPVKVITADGQELSYPVNSKNISESGIGLETQRQDVAEFQADGCVNIVIDCQPQAISLKCRVVRVQHNWLANYTEIGLEFVNPDEESSAALRQLLESLSRQRQDAEADEGKLTSWMKSSRDSMHFIKINPDEQSESSDKE